MAGRQRQAELGAARGRMIVADITSNARAARMAHGVSQEDVARALRISRSRYSRIERGLVPDLSIQTASRMLAVLGLELSARAYPAGEPIRDAAHAALLGRLRGRLNRGLEWQTEVPLPVAGDRRAWDAVISERGAEAWRVGVEAETRPRDLQALERRLAIKTRDGGMDAVVLLLANTRHNRDLVRGREPDWRERFPLEGRRALELLGAGVRPSGDAIVLL
jgi:transcriptional regulator with XRE-family HTH domain